MEIPEPKGKEDYFAYKRRIVNEFRAIYPNKYVDVFNKFISNRYDKLEKMYMHKSLLWRLLDDNSSLKADEALFYAIVGLGGSGKSTLACNMAYFHDPSVDGTRVVWSFEQLVKVMHSLNHEKYKAIVVDEPNDVPPAVSKQGKNLAEILGQIRQDNPIILFCSTDMKDIPNTIFRKLKAIVYIRVKGEGIYIRDIPYRDQYPLSDLKRIYMSKGYRAFQELMNKTKYPFLKFRTRKSNAIEDMNTNFSLTYLKDKKQALDKSYNKFLNKGDGEGKESDWDNLNKKDKIIQLIKLGKSREYVLGKTDCSIPYYNQAMQQVNKASGGTIKKPTMREMIIRYDQAGKPKDWILNKLKCTSTYYFVTLKTKKIHEGIKK